MRKWHFYRLSDGTLTGKNFSARTDKDLAANIPEGCAAIEGVTDIYKQRIDLETGSLIEKPTGRG